MILKNFEGVVNVIEKINEIKQTINEIVSPISGEDELFGNILEKIIKLFNNSRLYNKLERLFNAHNYNVSIGKKYLSVLMADRLEKIPSVYCGIRTLVKKIEERDDKTTIVQKLKLIIELVSLFETLNNLITEVEKISNECNKNEKPGV